METAQPSSLERVIQLSVPLAAVQAEVGVRLKKIAKTARMQGFRPGKVPMNVLVQQYSGQLQQEALSDLAQDTFGNAVRDQKMRVATLPRFDAKNEGATEGRFEFTATFEVYPEVKVGDVSAAAIRRPVTVVGDADVERTLDILRRQRVRFEAVERGAAVGDQVVLDFTGYQEGQPFPGGEAKGQHVVLGQGQFLPDFESNLTGIKAGEERAFDLTFPAEYHAELLAGKAVRFEVKASLVSQPILPDVNDEFARSVGVVDGNLTTMRAELKQNLEREVRNRIKVQVKDQVMQALLDATPMTVPQGLIHQEIGRLRQSATAEVESRTQRKQEVALPDELFAEQAQRRVTLGLILSELVQQEKLTAKPEQVRAVIEDMAAAYEEPAEMVRWYYQQPERMHEVESLVLEDNVVEWVCARAKTEDVPTPFEQLVDNR